MWTQLRGVGAAQRREAARRGQTLLESPDARLAEHERDRLRLLLMWLERSEPRITFPGGQRGVHVTCVAEINELWARTFADGTVAGQRAEE